MPKRTIRIPIMDGAEVLRQIAGERGVVQLLADHTLFLHPKTVAQTGGKAVFPVIRRFAMRGREETVDGTDVICCDNDTPTRAFLWAAGRGPGRDVQYNHVWTDSGNPHTYTALWNLCATPAFLAKLTDGTTHPKTVAAVQYRSYELFGYCPAEPPTAPDGYGDIHWAEPLDPVLDLEAELRARLNDSPGSRAALAARTIGWLFSDGPDDRLRVPTARANNAPEVP
jgi:hypothetical protein